MAITSISVVVTVVVLNFHYRGPSRKEVPLWLRHLILERLASCTCFSTTSSGSKKPMGHGESSVLRDAANACFKAEALRLTLDSLHEELNESPEMPSNESVTSLNLGDFSVKKRCGKTQGATSGGSGGPPGVPGNGRVQDEILRTLRYLLLRQEQEDHYVRVINEWRQMALVIDRFLFWIFFIVTLVSSLSFLVIVPLHRRGLRFT